MDIKNLYDERNTLVSQIRTIIDGSEKLNTEQRSEIEKMESAIDEIQKSIETENRSREIESKLSQPVASAHKIPVENRSNISSDEMRDATIHYWRTGDSRELRALQSGDNAEGGYTVFDDFNKRLVVALSEQNVMESIKTTKVSTSSDKLNVPVMTDGTVAAILTEENPAQESDPTNSNAGIDIYTFGKLTKISNQLLNDSAFDLAKYILDEQSRSHAAAHEAKFVAGTGSSPQGVVTGADTGKQTASASAITGDEVLDWVFSLSPSYRKNAVILMNDATIKVLRKLKTETSNYQYLWTPGFAGAPNTILDVPVYSCSSMATITNDAKVGVIFDPSFYYIVTNSQFSVKRLEELFAVNHQTGFVGFSRKGGALTVAAAAKNLVMAS